MPTTLLIDGDVLLYRFGFRGQDEADFGEGVVCEWTSPEAARTEVDVFIKQLVRTCGCSTPFICLSGPSKEIFRYDILPTYKHNRQDAEKPYLFHELKEHFEETYPIVRKPVLEADDSMGILSTKNPGKYVIASIDKDLVQIPGYHYNWSHDDKPKWIGEREADKCFFKQTLSGDPVDGFSGVPQIGAKKAEKIINQLFMDGDPTTEEVWAVILAQYQKKGLSEDYALTQARMARILRFEDWDGENQQPILWTPYREGG